MKYTKTCCKHPEGRDNHGTPEEVESRPFIKFLSKYKNLVGAEIGVRYGCNALRIFNFLNLNKLYLIDKSKTKDAEINLEKYKDKIIWLVGTSKEMYKNIDDNSLDFVYIDGDHRYEYVKSDILLYFPKVKETGWIGGHDYKDIARGRAVMKAVHEMFGNDITVQPPWWDWWAEKYNFKLVEYKNG